MKGEGLQLNCDFKDGGKAKLSAPFGNSDIITKWISEHDISNIKNLTIIFTLSLFVKKDVKMIVNGELVDDKLKSFMNGAPYYYENVKQN